jgi:formiminotetrahydrofolate cyclodeaminase
MAEGTHGDPPRRGCPVAEEPFLLALERSTPVPGGGSAAAYAASVGLALLEKIVRLESERPRPAAEERHDWEGLLGRVRHSAETFRRLREEDSETYVRLAEARRSRDEQAIREALEQAIACPVEIMKGANEALLLAREAGERCKVHLVADVLVVLQLLWAACRGAYHIASANLGIAGRSPAWKGDLTRPAETCVQAKGVFVTAEEAILARVR